MKVKVYIKREWKETAFAGHGKYVHTIVRTVNTAGRIPYVSVDVVPGMVVADGNISELLGAASDDPNLEIIQI